MEDSARPAKRVPAAAKLHTDQQLPASVIMASGAHQYPFLGSVPLPCYEQLKEEQELTPIEGNVPVSATTMVHMGPPVYAMPLRDHIVWSPFTTMYLNFCCLGVMALAFSVKAWDRKVIDDHNGANSYGSTARCLNITALLLSLLSITVTITLAVYFAGINNNGY